MDKDEILQAIRETSKLNGGKPLGRARFEAATGISQYDIGRYWVRFSEAQAEAGFTPNTKQQPFDQEHLLKHLALFVRELGHFPVITELRLKSHNDPTFPSANTFDRLGNKSSRISELIAYTSSHAEYQDVYELIGSLHHNASDDEESQTNTQVGYGFVYLVRGHRGEYKIGRTNLVDRRLSELGANASVQQVLIHEIKTDDPVGIESYWHKRFQDKRMRGEWFKLNIEDVRAFKRWKRIY